MPSHPPVILAIAVALFTGATKAAAASNSTSRQLAAAGCFLGHNIDFPGSDLTNVPASTSDKCCGICRRTNKCDAFTWTNYNGGTCWLKTARGDPKILIGADSCWMANTGRLYGNVFFNCDMPGNDLYSETGQGYDGCAYICSRNPSCKAVTWVKANGGTCYYKYDVRECVEKAGINSVVAYSKYVPL